jgi:phage terminase Nu1 subunit (DNA packaging protein)
MSQSELTKADAAERLGVSAKQLERYVHDGLPCRGTGRGRRFPWPEIRRWRDERLREEGRAAAERSAPVDLEQARARKADADADIAEMERDKMRGGLIPLEVHEERVAGLAGRLAAVCTGGLSRYVGEVQRALTSVDAQHVLESISDDLLRACQGVGDELMEEAAAASDTNLTAGGRTTRG